MKFIFALMFPFFTITAIFSQNYVDILKVTGNTTPLNKFDSSSSSTRVNEIVADLTLPVKLNDNNAIVTGLIYETVQTKLFANEPAKNISAVTLKAGLEKNLMTPGQAHLCCCRKLHRILYHLEIKIFR